MSHRIAVFSVLLSLVLFPLLASADPVPEGSQLEQRMKAIGIGLQMLDQQGQSLEAEFQKLKAEKSDLDAQDANWDASAQAYKAKQESLNAQIDRQQAVVAEHNGKCQGTFKDESYVNWCNQKAADINAWGNKLRGDGAQLSAERSQLQSQRQELDSRWDDLRAKVRQGTAESKEIDRKRGDFAREMQSIIQNLQVRARKSGSCADIQGIENVDLNNLDSAAEQASRCISQGFDR